MQPPSKFPTSLIIFQIAVFYTIGIFIGVTASIFCGRIDAITSFMISMFITIFFKEKFYKHSERIYWWLRIWWELNIKNTNQ